MASQYPLVLLDDSEKLILARFTWLLKYAVPKLTHFPSKNESNLELPQRTSIAILYGDCDWIFGLYALPVRNA